MASNNIGNLSIIISGNSSGLSKSLSAAQQQIQNFTQRANANLNTFKNPKLANQFNLLNGRGGINPLQRLVGMRTPKMPVPEPPPSLLSKFAAVGADAGKAFMGAAGLVIAGFEFAGPILSKFTSAAGDLFGKLTRMAVGFATTAGTFIKHAVEKAMDFQQFQMAFEVMTGSADKGTAMLETLERFSATVPFESERVYRAAQKLAGSGIEMENVLPALQAISAVVVGTGGGAEQFERMAVALSQVRAVGHLMGQERHQLTDAGFAMEHLAKALNTDIGGVMRMTEEGAISVNDLYRAFNVATREGIKFDGILARMAGTTKGRFLILQNELAIATRKIGEGFRQALDNSGVGELLLGAVRTLGDYIPTIQSRVAEFGTQTRGAFLEVVGVLGTVADKFAAVADTFTQRFLKPIAFGIGIVVGVINDMREALDMPAKPGSFMSSLGGLFGGGAVGGGGVAGTLGAALGRELGGAAGDVGTILTAMANSPGARGVLPQGFQDFLGALDRSVIGQGDRGKTWPEETRKALERLRDAGAAVTSDFGGLRPTIGGLTGDLAKLRDQIQKDAKKGFTPFEEFQKKAEQIDQLANARLLPGGAFAAAVPFMGGAGVVNPLGADMAFRDAFLDLEKHMDKFKDELPKAMEKNSADAASAINKALFNTHAEDAQTRMLKAVERQEAATKRAADEARDLRRAWEQIQTGRIR